MKTESFRPILTVICLGAALAFPMGAMGDPIALDQFSAQYIGLVVPSGGTSASEAAEVTYINHLIGLGANVTGHLFDGETYNRSSNYPLPNGLPQAILAGNSRNKDTGDQSSPYSITLPAGADYLLGKYDQDQAGMAIWYVGQLSGDVTVPGTWSNKSISHWVAFDAITSVPDGGLTVLLLGAALSGLGVVSRRLRK